MEHLKVEDIIKFISADKIDESFLELAATVNGHICKCRECLELVQSLTLIQDEFDSMYKKKRSGGSAYKENRYSRKKNSECESEPIAQLYAPSAKKKRLQPYSDSKKNK